MPLRLAKRLKAAKNSSVSRDEQTSKWTAFVDRQIKRQLYALNLTGFLVWPLFRMKGPAKSIPTTENGGLGEVLADGSKPICWEIGLALTCWQVAHFLDNFFRNALRQGMKKEWPRMLMKIGVPGCYCF